eukprot:6548378-Pyramimonas_sp.AAC.1
MVAARVLAPRGIVSGRVSARTVAVRGNTRLLSVAARMHRGAAGVCPRRLRQRPQRRRTRRGGRVAHRLIPGRRGYEVGPGVGLHQFSLRCTHGMAIREQSLVGGPRVFVKAIAQRE